MYKLSTVLALTLCSVFAYSQETGDARNISNERPPTLPGVVIHKTTNISSLPSIGKVNVGLNYLPPGDMPPDKNRIIMDPNLFANLARAQTGSIIELQKKIENLEKRVSNLEKQNK